MTAIRLLLLEDRHSDAELMLRELKRASLEVDAQRVETEEAFRKCLAEGNVDVILADYSLPTFDGESALKIARAIEPEVPFIFVSGSIGEERAINALRDGARDYILKDRMSRLGPAVRRALDERKELDLRRAAQEALRESESRFRSVAELAGDAILVTDEARAIVFANERAAWMFGYRADDLVGRDMITLLSKEARDDHQWAMESIPISDDSQTSLRKETTGLRSDGRKFPLEVSVSLWRRGRQRFFTTILRDVSDRVASAARLREAQELAHVGSWEYDLATKQVIWSEEVFSILALDPARVTPSVDQFVSMIHPDDRDPVLEATESQRQLGRPETIRFQQRILSGDGMERTVECRSRVVIGDDGHVVRTIGTVQDITEQAIAARKIEELSRRSEMILECAAEGIMGVGRDATITFVNPAALTILGRSREELKNCRETHDLIHHSRADGTPYPLEECPVLLTLQDGKKRVVTGEVFWRAGDEPFAVEYESAPTFEEGELAGCVLTFRDVTESQALERQLELAKRIGGLGRVAATIAHEFNNVMMGIDPFAEMIRRLAKSDEKIVQASAQISASVRRGRRVTEEILRFTQPSAPDLQGVDLREWLRRLDPELRALAGSAIPVMSLPEKPVYIVCDAAQLQQVVTNLFLNARDASPEGGQITIALELVDREQVALTLRDQGSGIPPKALEHIFEPLFTTKRTGTGLGLAVARQIITQHGGTIEATNLPTGGAEFRILLPVREAAPVPAAHAAKQPDAPPRFKRLLLVEDDELVVAGLTSLLNLDGFVTLAIERGDLILQSIESFEPDAVILDLTLPDIDGAEVFRRLRKRWPLLPVVFSTGHGSGADLAAELKGPRVEMLRKPYEIADLMAALRRITT